jgi:hypothetical protein
MEVKAHMPNEPETGRHEKQSRHTEDHAFDVHNRQNSPRFIPHDGAQK